MDKLERVARAVCAETCAFMGEPPCYTVEGEWPNPNCSEPGCHAIARAAIAALEPVSVQEAAIMVADHIDQDMNAANQMIDKFTNISLQMPVRHWLSQCLRALAEKDATP